MLSIFAMIFGIALCEVILGVISDHSPLVKYYLSSPWNRNTIPDLRLGFRMSPYYPGHDKWGYRNRQVPHTADVLAIGDSLTYGFAAPPSGSWPYQLGILSKKTVYNAGVGGYGPCEYERVFDDLLVLQPKIVIIGLYLGNDLSDAYKAVYIDGRCTQLKSTDTGVLGEIENADKKVTLRELAIQDGMETEESGDHEPGDLASSLRRWLARYSPLYGLLRSTQYALMNKSKTPFRDSDNSFAAAASRPFRLAFDAVPNFRTVFRNPKLDALAIDIKDPRIREGFRISQSVLLSMNARLNQKGFRLIVVLLHNKPYVYADLVRANWSTAPKEFFDLIAIEESATRSMVKFLEANAVTYVETLSALRSRFLQREAPYPESDDHHPNSTGYLAIAESILPFLETNHHQ